MQRFCELFRFGRIRLSTECMKWYFELTFEFFFRSCTMLNWTLIPTCDSLMPSKLINFKFLKMSCENAVDVPKSPNQTMITRQSDKKSKVKRQ